VLSVFGRRIKGMIRLRSEQVWTCNVTLHVHTCSNLNRIIPLMRRPNTDSTPNKPVTLPRNQRLIRYTVTSPVHTLSRYGVTIRGKVTSVYPHLGLPLQRTFLYSPPSSSQSVRMNVSTDNHVLTFAKDKLLCLLTWIESKKPATSGSDRGSHIFACGLQSKVPVHAMKPYWGRVET
jgi:hypothetical protein